MQQLLSVMHNPQVLSFIQETEKKLKDVPHIPKNLAELLVTVAPYLAVIGGVLSLVSAANLLFDFGGMYRYLESFGMASNLRYLSVIQNIIFGLLGIWAFEYLKKRDFTGWLMMFWSMVLSIVFMLFFAIVYGGLNLLGIALGILLGGYLLFELKPYYGKTKA